MDGGRGAAAAAAAVARRGRGGQGRAGGYNPKQEGEVLTMSAIYVRTPNGRGTFSRSILRDARPLAGLYHRRDDANEDDSQSTLQRFYVINTDALAGI